MRLKNYILILVAMILVLSSLNQVSAQVIQDNALRQIQSLIDEKESRTPAQKKLDSQLWYAIKEESGRPITSLVATLEINVRKDNSGLVPVDIRGNVSNALIKAINDAGGAIIFSSGNLNTINARIPLLALEQIAALDDVRFIYAADRAYIHKDVEASGFTDPGNKFLDNFTRMNGRSKLDALAIYGRKTIDNSNDSKLDNPNGSGLTFKFDFLPAARTHVDFETRAARVRKQLSNALSDKKFKPGLPTGPINSQGDVTHRAAVARTFFGVNGSGVKIGVLSDGVNSLAAQQAAGELPAVVTVLPGQAGSGNEGTAMLEIIYDLAPGAQLFFATAFTSQASFAQNILDLRTAGCDIIVDDVAYFREAAFQDDNVAISVNTVTAAGALYFSSAENEGNKDDNTSGVWEGDFLDAGTGTVGGVTIAGGTVHNFGGGVLSDQLTAANGGAPVGLFWSDQLGASGNDYDLYILDAGLTVVVNAATNVQDGNDDPVELSTISPGAGRRMVIFKKTAAAQRALHLNTFRGRLAISTTGQTHGHSSAVNAFSVAATPAAGPIGAPPNPTGPYPGVHSSSNLTELFSSDGPRRVFYNANGTAITPGNFLFGTGGGNLRLKPDITAADGTASGVAGFNPFYGTSAAAPHAAAIAGLVKSAVPAITPAQVRTALIASAIDIEAAGYDRDAGNGIVMAYEALVAAGAAPVASIVSGGASLVTESCSPANGVIDPDETVTVSFCVQNTGGANTVNLVGTLQATGGVTSPSGPQNYGVVVAGGPVVCRNFTFTASGACGSTITASIQFQDGATNLGTITYTFTLGVLSNSTTTFTNAAAITIPSSGAATPYPSNIVVSGLSGTVNKVTVNLTGLNHTFPEDVGMLLVGPGGQKFVILDGVIGGTPWVNINYTLDDAAAANIPKPGTPASGTFKPTCYFAGDVFPAPAPAGPNLEPAPAGAATFASAFNGINPNGTWSLYIVDFAAGDAGSVSGGWSLNITTGTFACCTAPIIVPAGATLSAENCTPLNSVIDPGETVTINFCLQNTGVANTANLVGTLQATGGVTSPSGPQNYGVVVAGGPAVCRPFTFTVGNVPCGTNIIASIQLQDGATNLGTISYNLTTGTIAPGTTIYSTGNIAVPIPDVSTVNIPLTIADVKGIADINVRFRLNHTFDGDLDISLVHPDGTVVPLVNNRGGSGANFGTGANDCSGTHTVIDDEAATPISAGVAPFAGSFRPESPLSVLDGKPTNGTWFLRVTDEAALDIGTVGCFQLEIQSRVCCGGPAIITAAGATLTAESCTSPPGAIDPNETVTVSFCVQNVGGSNTVNLVGTLQATGGVTSPSGPQNFGIVVGSGPAVCRPFTFTANGVCGGTITATIQLQDGATNYGTITYTFTLGVLTSTTTTFSNPAPILVPGVGTSGPAAPYPSNINVAGVVGTVSKVTVTLKNMNHTFPDDFDVLLVGPGGQRILLMSDAGGSADLVNNTYTFDDAAATALADAALNASGTYQPSNYGTGDVFPAPAPLGPYPDPQLLSVFNGVDPNGTWALYVFDDVGGDVGNINLGWELNISTSTYTCCVCSITCPANITVSNDPNQCGAVVNYPAPTTSGGCGTVTSNPPSGSFFPVGTTTVTATTSAGPSCSFTVTVNDTQPPTITCPANIILCGSQAVSYTVTASDNCPGVTVVSSPPSGSVFPVGTTTVTATATDAAGNTATCSFTVTIRPIPTVNPVPNQTVCNAAPTAPVIFSGPVPGTTFNWVNNTPSIGLAASGSGNIASFNAINLTNVPVTATVTVTPVTVPSATITFNYTGAFQTFVVPAGVTSVNIQASGAQGMANAAGVALGGLGGSASGTLTVTPGETLWVYVGGGGATSITGGFNGGGDAGTTGTCLTAPGGGGGGASDVRQGANTIANRRIVGGGGGGTAGNRVATCARGAGGGGGGGYFGGGGGCGYPGTTGIVPTGGTQVAGGLGGITGTTFGATNGLPGVLGIGGAGGNEIASAQAGSQAVIFGSGAGGGLTGGSGQQSGLANFTGQSGAGGSSYIGGVTGGSTTAGVRSGNGLVTISYAVPGPSCTGPSTSFTITVNPTPNAVATPPTQTLCSGTAMTPIVLSGNVSGTVFNWTRDNQVNVTGIPNSGSGNISGTPINNTTGQQTVTFTITPVANGCTGAPITATLIVNKAPTITCPANITVNNTPGQCGAIVNYPAPVVTGSPPPVVVSTPASGSFFPVGTTTVTATATNICGVATCTFTITVLDVQPPTITCPANITQNTDVGACVATVATPNPVIGDNCAVTQLTWVMTGATTGSSPATGINFVGTRPFNLNGTTGQGVTTITYTVRDAAGNTATCSFTVTVIDISIPVIGGQPTNQTVCVGSNAVFSVTATVPAGNPLTYQWQAWNGSAWVNIAGATNATLVLNGVTFSMNTNSYRVILTGRCSVVTSGFATLFVNQLPTVSILASGPLSLLPPQSVTLTAIVSPGGGTYQWFKNGVAIPGATGASLAGLTVNDVGSYTVRYTDLNGCVAISAAMVVSGQASDNLYVYPNPNDGHFHVRFYNQVGEQVTVNVYDAKGALIHSQKAVTTTPYTDIAIDLGGRNAAGTYLVVMRDGSGRQVGAKKIIVYDR